MEAATEKIPITFAGLGRAGTVPAWARRFGATRTTVADLCKASTLPGVAVVQSSRPNRIIEAEALLTKLFQAVVDATDRPTRLVLGFHKAKAEEVYALAPFIGRIPGLTGRIDLALQPDDLEDTLIEAVTKVMASRSDRDPLSEAKAVAATGRALRSAKGRLDAKKVASTFGLTLAELARQIGVTKQRISKTPDSQALQTLLRPYERVARLRSVLPGEDFKVWLNTPNAHLEDGNAPLDYLTEGAQEPLAHFAENMLTGAPA